MSHAVRGLECSGVLKNLMCRADKKKIPSTFEERNAKEAKGLVKRSALLNTRDWCSCNWNYVVSGPISMDCTMKR